MGIGAGESYSLALMAGTLPVPRLLNPTWRAGQFSVLLQTLNRKHYALQYKTSVLAASWTSVCTNLGNGALLPMNDPIAAPPQRYFRLWQW